MSAKNLRDRLDRMIETVRSASESVDAGTLTDLGTLDQDVAKLCADVEKASSEDAAEVAFAMSGMISALEELAQALKGFQDRSTDNKKK